MMTSARGRSKKPPRRVHTGAGGREKEKLQHPAADTFFPWTGMAYIDFRDCLTQDATDHVFNVYVCIYACMYVQTYNTYRCIHTYVLCVRIYKHVFSIYIYMRTCVYIYIYVYTHLLS